MRFPLRARLTPESKPLPKSANPLLKKMLTSAAPEDNSSSFSSRKQNVSAPDENNKHFQTDSISAAERAAAERHFGTINLLSHEEREPNFKMAYCVLPAPSSLQTLGRKDCFRPQ